MLTEKALDELPQNMHKGQKVKNEPFLGRSFFKVKNFESKNKMEFSHPAGGVYQKAPPIIYDKFVIR